MEAGLRVAMTLVQCWHRVPGGTATGVLGLARALSDAGEVDLVGVAPLHRRQPDPAFTPPIPTPSLPLPRHVLYDAWHHLRWPPVQRATGPVDVVHATALTVPPAAGAGLVVTVNDLFPLTHPEQFTRRGVRVMRRGWELVRRHADVVVVPSEATLVACEENGLDPARAVLIPYGVDAELASDVAVAAVRTRYGLSRPYVLWSGTVEPRKNLPVLLDAFDRLADLDVDLVLVGPSGWGTDVEADIARMGERVHRPGFVPTADLVALRRGAALCCFPSLREGFGLPVLEAMAQGTPVVTSSGTSTEEVVGDGGFAVPPTDAAAVAAAMRQLLIDPALARRMGEAGREAALTRYSWDVCAKGHVDAYQRAAAERRGSRTRGSRR